MIRGRLTAVAVLACPLFVLAGCGKTPQRDTVEGADPVRGRQAIVRYGCVACHAIPGIGNPGSNVGPPLHQFARRSYVGGVLPNTPAALVSWLMNPPAIDPRTAMPNMGVTQGDAADIAAYLYTLE
jgi:cytochrome c